jgi:hypothetical protein
MEKHNFIYENTETKSHVGGKKTVRTVSIKNGKGHKSITKYHNGKKIYTVKKPIITHHIESIRVGKIVP